MAKENSKDKFKRFQVKGGMNRIKDKTERLLYADDLKFHIIRSLEAGYNPFNNEGVTITNYNP